MSDALTHYRDDGPVVAMAADLVRRISFIGKGAGRSTRSRMAWLIPPLLRGLEYGFITWLAWRGAAHALPATYALLAAVAFHHYDVVYRLRHQWATPPRWVRLAGLGWEGRMIVMLAASMAGAYAAAVTALAAWCALLFVTESVTSWVRLTRGPAEAHSARSLSGR